jgi:hypothetical protein
MIGGRLFRACAHDEFLFQVVAETEDEMVSPILDHGRAIRNQPPV